MKSLRRAVLVLIWVSGSTVLTANDADAGAASALFIAAKPAILAQGTEAYRAYSGGAVVLRLKSTPAFGAQPADWPVVQVGPLAFAFMQVEGKGRVGVLRGNETSLLAEAYALDAGGRASDSIEVVLGCDPQSGTVVYAVGGNPVASPAPGASSPVEISVAAGSSAAWEISDLEVIVIGPDAATAGNAGGAAARPTVGHSEALDKVLEILRAPATAAAADSAGNPSVPAATPAGKPLPPDYIPLSISTPPAVRRSAAEVRAAVAQNLHR